MCSPFLCDEKSGLSSVYYRRKILLFLPLHDLTDPFFVRQSVCRIGDRRVVGEHVEFLFFDSQVF